MLTIRQASETDCPLIRRMAEEAFPATYREILTPAQLDYMMEWMYSDASLREQFRAGHVWFIASSDGEPCGYLSVERQGETLFHLQKIYVLPRFQGIGAGAFLFRHAVEYPERATRALSDGTQRQPPQPRPAFLRTHGHAPAARRGLPHRRRLLHERLYHGVGDTMKGWPRPTLSISRPS